MIGEPTPEEIADIGDGVFSPSRLSLLRELAAHGYVIVDPDDIPTGAHIYAERAGDKLINAYWDAKVRGWNECRAWLKTRIAR